MIGEVRNYSSVDSFPAAVVSPVPDTARTHGDKTLRCMLDDDSVAGLVDQCPVG